MITQFRAAATDLLRRYQFARQAGFTFGGQRDVWGVLGYPEVGDLSVQDFLDRYERGGIAGRIVDVLPDATWRGEMWLEEDEDPEKETPFEKAWEELEKRLAIRERFHQADKLARLSTYSVILLGTADGDFSSELPKGSADKLLYLQPYLGGGGPTIGKRRSMQGFEADVQIQEFDLDSKSARFALPLYYTLKRADIVTDALNKPIHWSRIIHVAEGTLRDDVYGRPALERVWNHLEDLEKVVGGGSEAFWIRANGGLHLNVDKDMQITSEGKTELTKLQEQAEEYQHQLTRMIRTRGVEINQLGSDVANFQSPADTIITLMAGATGIPKRLLVGSERGELASTQDRENFRDLINGRQANFAGPKIVRAFVDRLVKYGYLPKPKEYKVKWPVIETLSETEKGAGASSWASVNSSMGKTVFTEDEIRDKWAGMKPLTDEQKAQFEEEAAKKLEHETALIQAKNPPEQKVKKPLRAAEEGDDEIVRVLEAAIEAGADDVVDAIVGLGGPGSGNFGHSGRPGQIGGSGEGVADAKMKDVAETMKRGVERGMERDRRPGEWYRSSDSDSFNPVTKTEHGYEFGVRDFGKWEVDPSDRSDPDHSDEDFEDWDWKVPTKETAARLDKFVKTHQDQNPDLDIKWSAEEKNWLYFTVRGKKG